MGDEEERGNLRIYVGGLGGSVSEDDLRKTFTSPQLGTVVSVEIVRTKGRSFAYLDFRPVSDKGLAKLFSTYNGCMWKGGRLRLEKAKEHYLIRLKREWTKDAEHSHDSHNHDVNIVRSIPSSKKSEKVHNSENLHLQIFSPKLRKVKPVPFKGTGKHKYSFQHIEVPTLPIHFCDCEEHSISSEAAKEEPCCQQEKESGGMNDEELSTMNSVMNKIFGRENCSEATFSTPRFASQSDNSTNFPDLHDLLLSSADQASDEDNLVINMVAGSNNKISLSDNWGQKAVNATKDSQASKTRTAQRKRGEGRQTMSFDKKRKTPLGEDGDMDIIFSCNAKKDASKSSDDLVNIFDTQPTEPKSDILQSSYKRGKPKKSAQRDLLSGRDNATFHISDVLSNVTPEAEMLSKSDNANAKCSVEQENQKIESSLKEANKSTEAVFDIPNAAVNKSTKSTLWLQKSSWVELVSSSSNNSFSISQILPSLNLEKPELQQDKVTEYSVSTDSMLPNIEKSDRSISVGDLSKPKVKENNYTSAADTPKYALADSELCHSGLDSDQQNLAKRPEPVKAANEASTPSSSKKQPLRTKPTPLGSSDASETFTFMRSAASMKEWMKTKAALSGSLKKKRAEK